MRILTPERYHPNEEINELVAGFACAGFHPWLCIPRGCHRPISDWTIAEFLQFMAHDCGPIIAREITITVN